MTRARRTPLDKDLYAAVVEEAKAHFAVWPSAYASGWVVKTYKERGGRYAGQGRKESTGLTKWFGEEWVDLSRPTADGGYEPCGRKRSDDPADYPKCRPLREALRMSPDEVADAVRRKRRAEAQAHVEASAPARGTRARAPKRVATYRNPDVDTSFRRWFGDSVVVDAKGEPLVVWHGSPSVVTGDFFPSREAYYGSGGIYFTNRRKVAKRFGSHVTPAFLSLQNPYYDDGSKDVTVEGLVQEGYDGIVSETDFLDEDAQGELMFVVFRPDQVLRAGSPKRANPDVDDELPPLVEDADYHRIYDPEDFHWDVGYHWTSKAKAEQVLRDGFFSPLHGFEGHESGPIYVGVISSEAAREVDRAMRKKFGPDLVLGQRTYDHFASFLYDAVKKHHPEWNRLWYGKNPEDSESYGDTCLRVDLRGIGEWISETGLDAIETEDYTYGNGLFVDAKIPARFFSVHEGDEDERANPLPELESADEWTLSPLSPDGELIERDTEGTYITLNRLEDPNEILQEFGFVDEDGLFPSSEEGYVFIDELFVDRRDRKKGLGRVLVEKAVEGIDQDVWVVAAPLGGSEHPEGFYKKLGFEVVERNRRNQVLMVRRPTH